MINYLMQVQNTLNSQSWKISTYSLTGLLGLIILIAVLVVFVYGCLKLVRRIRGAGYQHLVPGDGNDNGHVTWRSATS